MARSGSSRADELVAITRTLRKEVSALSFGGKVAFVYNPLEYAWEPHEEYLRTYGGRPGVALLVGMNPGPWGMAQTGVPFGEVALVREWLALDGRIRRPGAEHPKRPVLGWQCARSEVSGKRLWGWARDRFGTADAFFERFFVWNFCPLSFMAESGANITPDKLPAAERQPLFAACDAALADVARLLEPSKVIGVGKFAEARARAVVGDAFEVGAVLHPSPASPIANRGWAPRAEAQLQALGVL